MESRRSGMDFASEKYLPDEKWRVCMFMNIKRSHRFCNEATVDIQQYIITHHRYMYKVTCLYTLSSYKLDKNNAQNIHYFVQNDRTVSRDCSEIRSHVNRENPKSNDLYVSCETLTGMRRKFFDIACLFRSSYIYIYISFLASLLDIRDIYKAEIISDSRKCHLGWTHAEYRVYRTWSSLFVQK